MTNPVDAVVIRIVERGTPLDTLSAGKLDSAELLNPTFSCSRYWGRGDEERNGQMSFE
jgi:hypothetical protein